MVQFNLPDNSKLTDGDYYKLESEHKRVKKFKIYRWSPEDDKNPRMDTFCLLYTSPSPRDRTRSRMPSSA